MNDKIIREVDLRKYDTDNYETLYKSFSWEIPEYFNMGEAISRNKEGTAIIYRDDHDNRAELSYDELDKLSNQVANFLVELGMKRGEVVGIMMGPRPETVAIIIGIYKIGGIALSISSLLGYESVNYRLQHSNVRLLFTDREDLKHYNVNIIVGLTKGEYTFESIKRSSTRFMPIRTRSNEPAHMFYTSGTSGPPKGVILSHASLLAHIPSYQFVFEIGPREDSTFSQITDWGWVAGITTVLIPTLYFGKPIVAYNRGSKLDPHALLSILEDTKVTDFLATPTALNVIRRDVDIRDYNLRLKTIVCGGSAIAPDLMMWVKNELRIPLNIIYGQTEASDIVGTNSKTIKPDIFNSEFSGNLLGKPLPGHIVEILNDNLEILPPGEIGEIALKLPDPIAMLEYYKDPNATANKIRGGWLLTGDLGWKDDVGYIWFKSRSDFIIKTGGYRIGPEEIEMVINQHPAVLESAVVGKEDPVRGEIIKAFIVLKSGWEANEKIKEDIVNMVKKRLASYAYPKEIEFVSELPKTETGKIKRAELKRGLKFDK